MVIPRERSLEEDCSHEETDDDGEIGESEGDYRDVYQSNELEGAVGYSLPISGVSEEENNENGFNEFEQYHSVQIRRPLGLELRHNHHDINYNHPREVSDETVLLGSELYINFLREEIRRLNLQEPECLMPQYARNPPIRSQNVTNFGLRLRHVANAFAEAPLRQVVKEKAECVNWDDLDFQSFSDLLFGLFQEGGVTSERVVVLFYFCSDLAVRALRDNITERFHTVTQWSQLYIVQSLSLWIQQNGGWATVLQQSVTEAYRLAMIGFCCVGILALAVLIRNNMKT